MENAIYAEVFASVKKKKEAFAITSKPRTALLHEGRNDVAANCQVTAPESLCQNPNITASTHENGHILYANSVAACMDQGQFSIQFGSSSNSMEGRKEGKNIPVTGKMEVVGEHTNPSKKIIDATMQCETSINGLTKFGKDVSEIMSKSRMTLFQGGEDDEPMAPQIIPSATFGNKCDMNDGVVDDMNTNSSKTIFMG